MVVGHEVPALHGVAELAAGGRYHLDRLTPMRVLMARQTARRGKCKTHPGWTVGSALSVA